MSKKQIFEFSATELLGKVQSKALTVKEIAEAFIARIEKVNPLINAIQQFNPGRILAEAEEADREIHTQKKARQLHGLFFTVKDACHVTGFKCSKGFPGFFNETSTHDATSVARLKTEGAIVLGITSTPELLLSYETDNLIYGRTNNPYDLNRTPGGSSGGEAAIICAGGSPFGIGTDAGGSIRQPAHYSGICGHKPTQGRVPLTGLVPVDGAGIITQVLAMGPMARFAEDLSLGMKFISAADGRDPHSPPVSFRNPDSVEIKNLRVAYFYHHAKTMPCEDTVKTLDAVVKCLNHEVAVIQEASPFGMKDIYQLHWETFMLGGDGGETLKFLYHHFGNHAPSRLAQQFITQAENCQFSMAELRTRFLAIEQLRYEMMGFMQDYDVIISPVAATPARFHGETHDHVRDFTYVMAHNLTGWPATVVPCGKSREGLPVGIQIAAAPWNDHLCLALARKLQEIMGVFQIPEIQPLGQ